MSRDVGNSGFNELATVLVADKKFDATPQGANTAGKQ
jgi:hypothetical protein